MLENKFQKLLNVLLDNKNEYITVKSISAQMEVSPRTVHNYLNSPEFLQFIYPASLDKKSNKGICLLVNEEDYFIMRSKLNDTGPVPFSYSTDIDYIMFSLLYSENLNAQDYCNNLYISLSKFSEYIKEIEKFIKRYALKLKANKKSGYQLHGDEEDIRNMFYHYLTTLYTPKEKQPKNIGRLTEQTESIIKDLIGEEDISKLFDIMNITEKVMNSFFTDEDYNMIFLEFTILYIRCSKNWHVNLDNKVDTHSQEYYYASLTKIYMEKDLSIFLSDAEIVYITKLYLSARKQKNEATDTNNNEVLEIFLRILSIRLNFELTNDFELRQNLLNHLRPAIHRIKHGMSNKNPLLNQIKENYTEIYMAVMTTIEDIEDIENIMFDSDELGYICLHIIAAVNRPSNIKKINTALICNEGLSIEIFLKNIIESYFREIEISNIFRETNIQQLNPSDYSLILNTTSHKYNQNNIVNISKNFTSYDHSLIRHSLFQIKNEVNIDSHVISNYLLFYHTTKVYTQESLIKHYCKDLFEHNYVTDEFYESVLQRMKSSGTYIARGIALPHGSKDFVQRSVISLIHLETPILWDNESTDLVILVAINDKDAKNYSYLFRKIMRIASNDDLSKELKHCTTDEQLHELLNKVSI